jgi:hypothetical protein
MRPQTALRNIDVRSRTGAVSQIRTRARLEELRFTPPQDDLEAQ